jgi:hypothetical protein
VEAFMEKEGQTPQNGTMIAARKENPDRVFKIQNKLLSLLMHIIIIIV